MEIESLTRANGEKSKEEVHRLDRSAKPAEEKRKKKATRRDSEEKSSDREEMGH